MKDLMANMIDFERNILMMENILVMDHQLNNQMMKKNYLFIENIIKLD
jgi:hypothetical protein